MAEFRSSSHFPLGTVQSRNLPVELLYRWGDRWVCLQPFAATPALPIPDLTLLLGGSPSFPSLSPEEPPNSSEFSVPGCDRTLVQLASPSPECFTFLPHPAGFQVICQLFRGSAL